MRDQLEDRTLRTCFNCVLTSMNGDLEIYIYLKNIYKISCVGAVRYLSIRSTDKKNVNPSPYLLTSRITYF